MQPFQELFSAIGTMIQVISHIWFIVLPIAFYILFKVLWMDYVHDKFSSSIEYTLLEVTPPQNIEKSPKLMESLFLGMAGVLKSFNTKEEFLDGMQTFKFSLEIVSNEGLVHMYIRTPTMFRNLVESHIYAQYPETEIAEAEDYVHNVPPVLPNKEWNLWGTDLQLVKEEALPIKTYKYFEEDITGKMIDPFAGLIEAMGKLGPNQKLWYQMIVEPLKEDWMKEGQKLVEKLAGRDSGPKKSFGEKFIADMFDIFGNIGAGMFGTPAFKSANGEEKSEEQPLEFRLTPGEKKQLEALEGNIGKNVFNTKMRFLYLGKREHFSKTAVASFMGGIKQFADLNLNSFKPDNNAKTFANYVLTDSRLRYRQRKIFRRYLDRDNDGKTCTLSSEELATLFHFPDMSVQAPFIRRVEAKTGGAPANLPIE